MKQDIIKIELPETHADTVSSLGNSFSHKRSTSLESYNELGFYQTQAHRMGIDLSCMHKFIESAIHEYGFELGSDKDICFVTLWPRQSYTSHVDGTYVLHVPVITNEHTFMVIGDNLHHLDVGNLYITNTYKRHTAFNLGETPRLHLLLSSRKIK